MPLRWPSLLIGLGVGILFGAVAGAVWHARLFTPYTEVCWNRASDDFIGNYTVRTVVCSTMGRSAAPQAPEDKTGLHPEVMRMLDEIEP